MIRILDNIMFYIGLTAIGFSFIYLIYSTIDLLLEIGGYIYDKAGMFSAISYSITTLIVLAIGAIIVVKQYNK